MGYLTKNCWMYTKQLWDLEAKMTKLAVAFILGIVVGTVGLTGVINVAQKGVDVVKNQSQELAK